MDVMKTMPAEPIIAGEKAKNLGISAATAQTETEKEGQEGVIMSYSKLKRKKRGRVVRAVAKNTPGGSGKIKKRKAYKKAYPKRGRPKKRK